MNLVIVVAAAIAAFAAMYYIFMDVQREKQRVNALALHVRKLEGMVWAYNIRGRHRQEADDEDDYHGEGSDPTDGPEAEGPDEPEEVVIGVPVRGFFSDMEPPAAVFLSVNPFAGSHPAEHPSDPRIEVADQEEQAEQADQATEEVPMAQSEDEGEVPVVDSFDSFNSRPHNDETDAPVGQFESLEPVKPIEPAEENPIEEETTRKGKVYADTAENRRLGRVGKPKSRN